MIDIALTNALSNMEDRSADALGYSTPGYQAKFHDSMALRPRSIGVPDPLSVSAPKDTFFVVENPDGSRSYIRAGNFQVREGKLLASDGRQVLGYPNDRIQGGLIPLVMPEGTPSGWVNIAADGTVSIANPKSQADRYSGSGVGGDENHPGDARLPTDQGYEMQKKATVNWDREIHGIRRNEYGAVVADPVQMDGPVTSRRSPASTESYTAGMLGAEKEQTGGVEQTASQAAADPNDETGLGLRAAMRGGAAGSTMPMVAEANAGSAAIPPSVAGGASDDLGLGGLSVARDGAVMRPGGLDAFGGIGARGDAREAGREGAPDRAAADRTVNDAAGDRAADAKARLDAGSGVGFSPVGAGATAGSSAPPVGMPIGKIALARFAAGTTVTRDGSPTARVPVELGTPKTGQIGVLKTNSRDLGSVDPIRANTAVMDASHLLSAVMAAEQSRQSRAKKAMDLIK